MLRLERLLLTPRGQGVLRVLSPFDVPFRTFLRRSEKDQPREEGGGAGGGGKQVAEA